MNERGILSDKQKIARKITQIAKSCRNLDELKERLHTHSIQTYNRNGLLTGVLLGKRKFRLTTLGVGKVLFKELTFEQKRLDGLTLLKQQLKTKGLER